MLIKFMGGRGGGGPIAAYLVDASRVGREESAPEVLRGDIELTRELIDSIDRKWTYTTGVVSFAIEDVSNGMEVGPQIVAVRVGSGAVPEAPALVAGLDDLAVMGEAVEQGRGHLGVAEDARPLAEGEVGGDDH